jgi:CHAT domain-containing protein
MACSFGRAARVLALCFGLLLPAAVVSADAQPAASAAETLGKGAEAFRAGDLDEAVAAWSEALRICRLDGDTAGEADLLARRGEALDALGFVRAAVDDLTAALQAAEQRSDRVRVAALTGALGNVLFHARQLEQAQPQLERSLSLARQDGSDAILGASANNAGNVLAALGQRDAALARYAEAAAAARRLGDNRLYATAETNRARLLLDAGDTGAALGVLNELVPIATALPAPRDRTFGLVTIGRLALRSEHRADRLSGERQKLAYQALRGAETSAEAAGDRRGFSLASGYLGELYERAGHGREAARLTDQALFAAQELNAPDLLYRWEWQAGRLYRQDGDGDAAIAAYRRAVANLQAIRQDVPVEYREGRSSFRETVGLLYYELADLLLQRADPSRGNDVAPLLDEARNTVETLKVAEVRDYFQNPCIVGLEAKRTTIESVSPRTAALYPIVLPDRVELLLSLPDGKRHVAVPVDQQRLTAEVRRFRSLLEKRATREFLGPARQLYSWLIAPIEKELEAQQVDTIVFVPDGALRGIPIAALFDGEDFLIRRFAVATAPSLTLIEPKPIAQRPRQVLVAGLTLPVQGYPGLPNVGGELDTVSRLQGGRVLRDETFRLAAIEKELTSVPYGIVHIASHGEFSGDPSKSFVLAYDDKLTLDRLERALKSSEYRDEPLELLMLSACRTAAGDDRAALGLAGVAIKAGARSAVASLWFISDQASSQLVSAFYERLRDPSLSKAKAMQQAQLAMLNDARFRHPGYWAPFLVIGNWL